MLFASSGALGRKVCQLRTNLPPQLALPLVQPSFANRYLMKAKLRANVNRKAYGLSSITYCCSGQHKQDFSKREKTDCQSVFFINAAFFS
jgi:hypothetical protein